MTIDTFDSYSLAGNEMFRGLVRTSMRRIGPTIIMQLKRVAAQQNVDSGDQAIALTAINAVSAILQKLGIQIGGGISGNELDIGELIQTLLASESIQSSISYDEIKKGVLDGTLRTTIDKLLYEFLKEMTGLNEMSPQAISQMHTTVTSD